MDDNMITCTCGKRLAIVDSRFTILGELTTMRRLRKCKSCGGKFYTIEIPEEIAKEIYLED